MFTTTESEPISELSFALSQTFIMPKYDCVNPARTYESETVLRYSPPAVISFVSAVKKRIICSGNSAVPSVNTSPTSSEYRIVTAKTSPAVRSSPLPQYCAARTVNPNTNAP